MKNLFAKLFALLLGAGILFFGCELGQPADSSASDCIESIDSPEAGTVTGPTFDAGMADSRSVASSPYFKVTQSGDRYLVEVNLRPTGYTYYEGAVVDVKSTADASGWRVNIGDSPTNNGYGGDGGSTQYDSELQLLNKDFFLYRNDLGGSGLAKNVANWGGRKYRFELSNNYLSCSSYNILGIRQDAFTVRDPYIFNFSASSGYTFHVGINQTVSSARYGTGMSDPSITLINPRTGVYLMVSSIANYPGAYDLGHMGLAVGSDTNNMGWHFFSIERDNSPYILSNEIIWKHELPAAAQGSVSGGSKYSVLYHHTEATREALFSFLEKNAPGVANTGDGVIKGQGYDRIALLERYDFAQAKSFLSYVMATPSSLYNVLNNNCASFSTYAIEGFYGVECNDNSWHVPNHLFDDLLSNPEFTIVRDDKLEL